MANIVKILSGLPGLDLALMGGIPESNIVLISGGAGTGKTTLGMQFVVEAARQNKRGLFISTEQSIANLIKHTIRFAPDINDLLSADKIRFVFIDILEEKESTSRILETIKGFAPERIVLDSLTTFSEHISLNEYAQEMILKNAVIRRDVMQRIMPLQLSERTIIKRMLSKLLAQIRLFNATVLLTSELPEKGDGLSSDGISEFLADGVILLKALSIGDSLTRTLEIKKMRYTCFQGGVKTYDLTDAGLVVIPT